MFRRHSIDITDILHPDDQNLLAVPVYPPDHPGRIPPHGGQGPCNSTRRSRVQALETSSGRNARIKEDDNVNISFFMYWRRGDPVSNPYGPLDHDLFLLCARDTVKLLRNHPILSLWVGGNERVPPPDVNAVLKNDLQLHPYYMNSNNSGTSAITPVIKDPSRYLDSY
ncbi:hypothetical protein T459_20946 [Capsicum annuum]|uniref:Uncharacterized protein n=1 Tax=Capsicum annuum TaxID=4072 RepID=A0A2G2Z638_CAPAN|nr:hypothetical protein T459_20946 [Capsicum annuum]